MLKMFTVYEHSSISLLYILRLLFAELHAFKPCTSKEGNSEIYLIATNYHKTEKAVRILQACRNFIYDR